MVKLNQNYRRYFTAHRNACSTQQTPSHHEQSSVSVLLLSLRARYYDPSTGEFTSQDPLEYVDGMSLYRAYFAKQSIDPLGLSSKSCVEKICDVTSFKVKFQAFPQHVGGGTSLYGFQVDIDFKDDEKHDPALCEYRQFVSKSAHLQLPSGQDAQGNQILTTFWEYDATWEDDGYSRADDQDGKPQLPHPGFITSDGPGANRKIHDGWKINFKFTTQQAVYDIKRKEWVAATPPVTVIVAGIRPRNYFGPWGGGIYGVIESRKQIAVVNGVKGQEVFGQFK